MSGAKKWGGVESVRGEISAYAPRTGRIEHRTPVCLASAWSGAWAGTRVWPNLVDTWFIKKLRVEAQVTLDARSRE